jgi:hypothetical protein
MNRPTKQPLQPSEVVVTSSCVQCSVPLCVGERFSTIFFNFFGGDSFLVRMTLGDEMR